MNIWQSIGISVFSSFTVLVVIAVFKILWDYWFCNVWLKITCRHIIDISGKWNSKTNDAEVAVWEEDIVLKQYGWKVKGMIVHNYSSSSEGSKLNGKFEFEGIFREGILSCHFWNSNRKKKGVGSFVLSLKEDGNKFCGEHCYYDTASSDIRCIQYTWTRDSEPCLVIRNTN